jgi:hypothetical protein
MRFFVFGALWLSSVVTAELITITEWRKCSTSAAFPVPTYSSTSPANPSSSSSSSSSRASSPVASARPTGAVLGSIGPDVAASTVQSKRVDFLFWLEFANAVRTAAKIQPSDSTAFFIGSEAQTGPLAGSNIYQSFTNQGIYGLVSVSASSASESVLRQVTPRGLTLTRLLSTVPATP